MPSICLSVFLSTLFQIVSTKSVLRSGWHQVVDKQLYTCTLSVGFCSAWPKPISASKKLKLYNFRNSCLRIILVDIMIILDIFVILDISVALDIVTFYWSLSFIFDI